MIDLVEQILSENHVSANDLFEYRMRDLAESKTIEMKKQLQAEAMGGLTKDEIEAKRKAGYRKASEVIPDPRTGVKDKPRKTVAKTPADEWKGMSFSQKKDLLKKVRGMVAKHIGTEHTPAPKSEPTKSKVDVAGKMSQSAQKTTKAPEVKISPDEVRKSKAPSKERLSFFEPAAKNTASPCFAPVAANKPFLSSSLKFLATGPAISPSVLNTA